MDAQTKQPSLEFKVRMTYGGIPSEAELRRKFNEVTGDLWDLRFEDCCDDPRERGEKTFVLRAVTVDDVFKVAQRENCYVARVDEALEFAVAHPDVQKQYSIYVAGSIGYPPGAPDAIMIELGSRADGRRCITAGWYARNSESAYFLLIRKK